MGQIYVPVDANTANSIMTLNTSGGETGGGFWIYWNSKGFIGLGWYFSDTPLAEWWSRQTELILTYGDGETGFQNYINTGKVDNLDDALGSWNNKLGFLIKHPELYKEDQSGCAINA